MNLASNKTRDVEQLEKIGRRTSIVTERRDTSAQDYSASSDIRTARRGDVGGAEALMRTLGVAEKATSDLQAYAQNKHAVDEAENKAQGAADQATGRVDAEREQRSLGYRNAVTKGRTMTEFNSALRTFDEDLRGLIEQQDAPDLETRQSEVRSRLETFYNEFAVDPETGELRPFLQSPGAMRYLADGIQSSRPQFEAAALSRIEERFNGEALDHFTTNVVDQALANPDAFVDVQLAYSLLPDTVPRAAAAARFTSALASAAGALRTAGRYVDAVRVYDAVLGGRPAQLDVGVSEVGPGDPNAAPSAPSAPAENPSATSGAVRATGTAGEFATAFRSAGLPEAVIAGFLGNIEHESSFDSSRVGDNGSAFGHVQWRADRVRNFQRVVGVHPRDATPAQSVQFIKWELDNPRAAGMTIRKRDAILNAQTPEEAARLIDEHYERSDGQSREQRASAARGYFDGTAPGGSTAGSTLAPDDPITRNPQFRLRRPNADPITQYEQSGISPTPVDAASLGLTPEQLQQMRESRDQLANSMRSEWAAKVEEEQGQNGMSMALRLFGQGAPLTSVEITAAIEQGQISAQAGMSLFGMLRSNAQQAQQYADRQTVEAERARAAAERDQTERVVGRYISAITSGRMTAPQARESVLREMGRYRPAVAQAILNGVMGIAGDTESAVLNGAGVREQIQYFDVDQREQWQSAIASSGLNTRDKVTAQEQASAIHDQMQAELITRIQAGASVEDATAIIDRRYGPRLNALLPPRR